MLKKLINKIDSLKRDQVSFNPSSLNDSVALGTEWTPVKGGGANFKTHDLVKIGSNRLEYRASVGMKLFCLLFLLIGIGMPIAFLFIKESEVHFLVPLMFGISFSSAGALLLYHVTVPIVFDEGRRCFWRGRKAPNQVIDTNRLKAFAEFKNIHALQLISEKCRGKDSTYYSYEMNVVLLDGERINVVDHGDQKKLREDAELLSEFLGKPVWDAI